MRKPNIIFYFSDQQRYDTVTERTTPNLKKFGKEGSEFNNTYTCQPVCGPARACLQTGVYASQNNCFINGISMDTNAETLAKIFNKNDYETAYIGKWHLASDNLKANYMTKPIPVERRGGYKDYWMAADCLEFTSDGYGGFVYDIDNNKIDFKGVRADCINDFAIDYINNKTSDKPFFMFISQLEPHHQNSTDKYECPLGSSEKFKDYPIPEDLTALKGNYTDRYADYLACIERLDMNVAKLAETLKEKGMWENTIIIYTSDHGCHFRTRNMEYKRSCHDASIHVPLIIFGGAWKTDKDYDGLVSLIDLPSTILAMAGIDIPKQFMGNNIMDMMNGKNERDNVYIQISESQLGRAVRTKDFTYSVKKRASFGIESAVASKYVEDFLYDNNADPHQQNNLIKDKKYNAIKEELKDMLKENMNKCGEKPAKIVRKLF